MKKLTIVMIIALVAAMYPGQTYAQDPITEAIKAGVKKVIKAVDLKIQRLQNETIWLQNAQKLIENKMSALKLTEISEWAEKQKKLYADYFDALSKVKNIIAYYHRIKDVTKKQVALVEEYKKAYGLFKKDKHFTPDEIKYMGNVYAGIIDESIKNLDQLLLVINSFSTKMTDAKRLEIIDGAADQIEKNFDDLKMFNNQSVLLSLQRGKSARDIDEVKALYGLNN